MSRHVTVLTDHQSWDGYTQVRVAALQGGVFSCTNMILKSNIAEELNRVANALTRTPLSDTKFSHNNEVCVNENVKCKWYKRKKADVERNLAEHPDYSIRENRLYRHFWEPELFDPWKLCEPIPQRTMVLEENHYAPTIKL